MDELVHHCLRELAFDGDLGKFVSVIPEDGERAGSNQLQARCRLIARLTFGLFRMPPFTTPRLCYQL
jgi:hypothetical protein